MATCDICKLEFPSSEPNVAKFDGPTIHGPWAYACEAHKAYLLMTVPLKVAGSKFLSNGNRRGKALED